MREKADGIPVAQPVTDLMVSPATANPGELIAYPGMPDYGQAHIPPGGPGRVSPLTLLLRRKWLVLSIFAVVAGSSIPCIWLLFAPSYRATAVVRISPVIEPIVFKNEKSGVMPFYQSYINTEVSVIYSSTVLTRALENPAVQATSWYKQKTNDEKLTAAQILERLQKDLAVSPRGGTELIDVSMTADNGRDAKIIVDEVMAEYLRLKEDVDKDSDVELTKKLDTEHSSLQKEIEGNISARMQIASDLGTDAPEQLRSKMTQQLSELKSELKRQERELQMIDWQMSLGEKAETMPANAPDRRYATDSKWQELYFEQERARSEMAFAREQYGELNPRRKQAVSRVELAERMVKERESQLEEAWASESGHGEQSPVGARPRQALEKAKAQLLKQAELLKKDIADQQKEIDNAGNIALQIARMDENIRQRRELYEAVRSRRDVLQMERGAPARVKAATYAIEPSRPHNDRRIMLTAMAIFGGLGLGIAVGYLRSAADKRIYDANELQFMNQAPFLGLLPKISMAQLPRELGGGLLGSSVPKNGEVNPRLMLMENMRMVRTTLLERVGQTGERVFLITSSLQHTGKSSVAVLLAQSLALVGKKVLLVEADLHRPVLSQRLGAPSTQGLASLLRGESQHDEVVMRPGSARFDLISAGEVPQDFDPELLANGVFAGCMKRWRQSYDFVLLDSPPLLGLADSQILASSVDGTIMVLRSSHDRRTETVEALSQLAAVGGTLLGTVLIGGHAGSGYGDYNYYSGYGNYSQQSEHKALTSENPPREG